ncbi:hypothetical protein TWF481_002377 [Arthrobotrys musiformis]|uniref:Precorrin-2 dehydrogenase n=1 Tax=Arthrobotrys musiformis TaxID=47236 RepID=A0AAV9VU79_9PEZI
MSRCPRKQQVSTMTAPEFLSTSSNTVSTPTTITTAGSDGGYTPPLLTSTVSKGHVHLIIGCNALAAARVSRSLEVGAVPTVIFPQSVESEDVHSGLKARIDGGIGFINREFEEADLMVGRSEVGGWVDAVFFTLSPTCEAASSISKLCVRNRVPVNVADSASLSTFTLLSTYSDGPLQIGITTSGMGCKLASRIRRTISSSLPVGLGAAVERIGALRRRVINEDLKSSPNIEDEDDEEQKSTFNTLINPADLESQKSRRMRWLSQICEYWPLQNLIDLNPSDIDSLFDEYTTPQPPTPSEQKGKILLVGSGPGDPNLLTKSSLDAINSADLILADKLIPSQILSLIPRRTPLFIARKFPGNAEAAQEELLQKGLDAVSSGKTVVRLKQGDPYIYGRGAEEYQFFSSRGIPTKVLPGITSALSAPLYAAIPSTHRAVADQLLICTGTGRKGVPPDPPIYIKSQTTIFLMACHRLQSLITSLIAKDWPEDVPCAVIERASCEDQRVIRSTLSHIVAAVEELGSRPPGLFVVGWACEVLKKSVGPWSVEEGL